MPTISDALKIVLAIVLGLLMFLVVREFPWAILIVRFYVLIAFVFAIFILWSALSDPSTRAEIRNIPNFLMLLALCWVAGMFWPMGLWEKVKEAMK